MDFHRYPTKQAQNAIFSTKSHSLKYPDLYFNGLAVEKAKTQEHLRFKPDKRKNCFC